jgi:choline dehydrogenase-like flavoprotein
MAASPEVGVVEPNLRIWETDNLFVHSNAAIPAIGAANLTLTLAAVILKAFAGYAEVGALTALR